MTTSSLHPTVAPDAPARPDGPLRGLKVLELGHFIAAPFCTRMLADQGADVIKVEARGGEPLRNWGLSSNGKSIIWSLHNRNKRCITLDMKNPAAQPAIEGLIRWADVVVENFRPGQLEKWGYGYEAMQTLNPRVILCRISGYGQDGPYHTRHSFGAVGEAMGGLRYLTGYPAEQTPLPPVRTGVSIGDDLSALYAVGGILAAVYERDVAGTGRGRQIDVALYEGVFSMLEGILPEYGTLGVVRDPQGSAMPTAVPSDTYRTADERWLVIAGNSDAIYKRLCKIIGREDMAEDPEYRTNSDRIRNRAKVDAAIATWVATVSAAEGDRILNDAGVPATRAYTVRDCAEDPHFRARDMIVEIDDPLIGKTLHPGIVPRFDANGAVGRIAWPGPDIGAHNEEVFGHDLGMSSDQINTMRKEGAV
ncbi:CoA transferase [uncultured Caballeronia sp.]|uniref:CaiB/BaiF CoA transferase family protein n=1 Tax=uncultured Caballeronia sp. TaxID=1827198 RepID=UPI00157750A2